MPDAAEQLEATRLEREHRQACRNRHLAFQHDHQVEPSHDPDADRWGVRLQPGGNAEVLPPLRVDATRRSRVHARS